MTDDAHGLGICSAREADVQMGTLSKAAGSYGGYVCARSEVIAFLENKARSLLFATGLPPASVAAAVGRARDHEGRRGAGEKAAGKRTAVYSRTGSRAGAKPDRAGDRGRGRNRPGGLGHAGSEWLPGRPDPPPHRAAGHGPAAVRVFGDASSRKISTVSPRS